MDPLIITISIVNLNFMMAKRIINPIFDRDIRITCMSATSTKYMNYLIMQCLLTFYV